MWPPISTKAITILTNKSADTGLVIASYGKRYQVEGNDGQLFDCVTRGKKHDVACGDQVSIKVTAQHEAVIEQILPRSSLLFRSNAFRSKVLAANVSQIIVVVAAVPSFYESLLNRCLVAASHAGIDVVIVLNKAELSESQAALAKLALYQDLGYQVLSLSAQRDCSALLPYLQGQTSILVGQSGMGKSTIINALLPHLQVRTREVSAVLDSGKHTTTATHLYHLNKDSHLIDSPGLQEFGLQHLSVEQLEQGFIEFRPYLGKCRFNNCQHSHEPDCAVLNAVQQGKISPLRLGFYQELLAEFKAPSY